MTTRECLTNLILSRTYNKEQNCACYGKLDKVCKMGFESTVHYPQKQIPTDTYKVDRDVYDAMYPYCKDCEFCDVDDLPETNPRAYKKRTESDFERGSFADVDKDEKCVILCKLKN